LPSRLYYGLDTLVGVLTGQACPNCATPGDENRSVLIRHLGVTRIRECNACGLLYRPVGFPGGKLLQFYYSYLYTEAGVATTVALSSNSPELRRRMSEEGKDRSEIVAALLDRRPARVCVLGCSWGYELLPLAALGCDVFGIELSKTRRDYGRRTLGLRIHGSVRDAGRAEGPVDVLISSHILEHVPRLTGLLTEIQSTIRPRVQVHITPAVDAVGTDAASSTIIGREHPIGLTRLFWERLASCLGLLATVSIRGAVPGQSCGESIAILRA